MAFRVCILVYYMLLTYYHGANSTNPPAKLKEAYVTILWKIKDEVYQEGFDIGVRVLGQSLKESGTEREMIVLCTPDVPEETKHVLALDGWTVKITGPVGVGHHFKAFILKLQVWLLTEYRRIVWLDSDTLVVQNIDELFRCGSFCVVYRHTDMFNAGVMVMQPSMKHYNRLKRAKCSKLVLKNKLKCGDQAILNEYFDDLKYSKLFNQSDPSFREEPLRLPWVYNADVIMYYGAGYWRRPESDIKVYHYTMGSIKPMQWYTYPLFDLNWKWNEYRERLPYKFNEPSIYSVFNVIPFICLLIVLLLAIKYLRWCISTYLLKWSNSQVVLKRILKRRNALNKIFPFIAQSISYVIAFYCVPTTMRPKEAWIMYGVWIMLLTAFQYLLYCSFLLISVEGLDGGLYMRQNLMRKVKCQLALCFGCFCLLYILQIGILFNVSSIIKVHSLLKLTILFVILGYLIGYCIGQRVIRLFGQQSE